VSHLILDTSYYVSSLRQGTAEASLRVTKGDDVFWLSAVVLAELYAGVRDRRGTRAIEAIERDFRTAHRLLVPEAGDWSRTGRVLAQLKSPHDYELRSQAKLLNDVLIALSAGRIGATVVTMNARDFRRIQEFAPFHWRLRLP